MRKLSALASAFKDAIKEEEAIESAEAIAAAAAEAEQKRLEAEEKDQALAAQKARAELLDELAKFVKDLGIEAKKTKKTGLTIKRGDRKLVLTPVGDEDKLIVKYEGSDESDHIARDVAGDWLLTRRVDGDYQHLELITDGLQELLVDGVGLPRPGGQGAHAPKPIKKPMKIQIGMGPPKVTTKEESTPTSTKKIKMAGPGGEVRDLSNPWD
jgi:hypothetical protein